MHNYFSHFDPYYAVQFKIISGTIALRMTSNRQVSDTNVSFWLFYSLLQEIQSTGVLKAPKARMTCLRFLTSDLQRNIMQYNTSNPDDLSTILPSELQYNNIITYPTRDANLWKLLQITFKSRYWKRRAPLISDKRCVYGIYCMQAVNSNGFLSCNAIYIWQLDSAEITTMMTAL